MSTHDEFNRQCLYVNPEIKKFKNVKTVSDYLKTVSRDRRWRTGSVGRTHRFNMITGVLALGATVFALLITAGMRVL